MFLPSIFGIKILRSFKGIKTNYFDCIINYLSLLILSNTLTVLVAHYFFNLEYTIESTLATDHFFAVKYTLVCLLFNVVLALIFEVFTKNIKITINVEDKVEKTKKKTKKNVKKDNS
jgi:Na+/phosphate symporter